MKDNIKMQEDFTEYLNREVLSSVDWAKLDNLKYMGMHLTQVIAIFLQYCHKLQASIEQRFVKACKTTYPCFLIFVD